MTEPNFDTWINKIYNMDCRQGIVMLPDNSVDMVITSPPYWSKRDYSTQPLVWGGDSNCEHEWEADLPAIRGRWGDPDTLSEKQASNRGLIGNISALEVSTGNFCSKCGAWQGQLGLEPTPEMFVEHLLEIFDGVKRVLTAHGSVYVNLGDTYAVNRRYQVDGTKQIEGSQPDLKQPQAKDIVIPEKSLCCIPDMFKIGMVKRGWICRSEIIWQKCNAMPESSSDRFTVDFEKLYFFVKSTDILYWTNEKTLELVTKQPKGIKGIEGTDWDWRLCPRCQREIPENGANFGDNNKEPYKQNNPHTVRLFGGEAINSEQVNRTTKIPLEQSEQVVSPRARYHRVQQQEVCTRCGGTGKIKVSLWSSHDYYFEQQFEPHQTKNLEYEMNKSSKWGFKKSLTSKPNVEDYRENTHAYHPYGRNKRSVWFPKGALWSINTKGFKDAHFAVFPEELLETPLNASCPEFVCQKCGMPKVKIYKNESKQVIDDLQYDSKYKGAETGQKLQGFVRNNSVASERELSRIEAKELYPDDLESQQEYIKFIHDHGGLKKIEIAGYAQCICNKFRRGIVLDPFSGSGTTAVKARKMNRDYIGFELNPKYIIISQKRLAQKVLIDFFDDT